MILVNFGISPPPQFAVFLDFNQLGISRLAAVVCAHPDVDGCFGVHKSNVSLAKMCLWNS